MYRGTPRLHYLNYSFDLKHEFKLFVDVPRHKIYYREFFFLPA